MAGNCPRQQRLRYDRARVSARSGGGTTVRGGPAPICSRPGPSVTSLTTPVPPDRGIGTRSGYGGRMPIPVGGFTRAGTHGYSATLWLSWWGLVGLPRVRIRVECRFAVLGCRSERPRSPMPFGKSEFELDLFQLYRAAAISPIQQTQYCVIKISPKWECDSKHSNAGKSAAHALHPYRTVRCARSRSKFPGKAWMDHAAPRTSSVRPWPLPGYGRDAPPGRIGDVRTPWPISRNRRTPTHFGCRVGYSGARVGDSRIGCPRSRVEGGTSAEAEVNRTCDPHTRKYDRYCDESADQ